MVWDRVGQTRYLRPGKVFRARFLERQPEVPDLSSCHLETLLRWPFPSVGGDQHTSCWCLGLEQRRVFVDKGIRIKPGGLSLGRSLLGWVFEELILKQSARVERSFPGPPKRRKEKLRAL